MELIKIGFSGKFRSGKTFAARYTAVRMEQKNISAQIFSLAAPVKTMCRMGLNKTDRETFQLFGTNVIRKGCAEFFGENGKNFWVNYLLNTIKDRVREMERLEENPNFMPQKYFGVLCDDIRFKSEFDYLKDDGWHIIRLSVERDKQLEREDASKKCENWEHPSEIDLDEYERDGKFSYIIDSNCTLGEFYKTLDPILTKILNETKHFQ